MQSIERPRRDGSVRPPCALALLLLLWGAAHADDVVPAAASLPGNATSTAPAPCKCARAGTPVVVEITEALSSQRHTKGEMFAIRLVEPVTIDGSVVVPAGAAGMGEVIHAASSRGGGAPGELLLGARYLEAGGRRIPLRGMKLGVQGKDTSNAALAASFGIGPFALFIHGHEIEVPAGTRAQAKLAADTAPPQGATPDDASTTPPAGTTPSSTAASIQE